MLFRGAWHCFFVSATFHLDSIIVLNLVCGYMWCCLSLPVGYVVLLNGANPPDLVVVYPYAILLGPFVNTLAENKPQVCTSILHSACLWCTSICYHFEYLYKSVAFLKVIINVTCHLGRKPQIYMYTKGVVCMITSMTCFCKHRISYGKLIYSVLGLCTHNYLNRHI